MEGGEEDGGSSTQVHRRKKRSGKLECGKRTYGQHGALYMERSEWFRSWMYVPKNGGWARVGCREKGGEEEGKNHGTEESGQAKLLRLFSPQPKRAVQGPPPLPTLTPKATERHELRHDEGTAGNNGNTRDASETRARARCAEA